MTRQPRIMILSQKNEYKMMVIFLRERSFFRQHESIFFLFLSHIFFFFLKVTHLLPCSLRRSDSSIKVFSIKKIIFVS